jgi:hypothetical protein
VKQLKPAQARPRIPDNGSSERCADSRKTMKASKVAIQRAKMLIDQSREIIAEIRDRKARS